jgi:hypothetical protein
MDRLEREAQREAVRVALERARQAYGSTVLVSSDAGVGKTAFVTDFIVSYRPAGWII